MAALYGPWGSRKTSIKNMVVEILKTDPSEAPAFVEFNPWQWAGKDQIAAAFFGELASTLGRIDKTKAGRKQVAKWIRQLHRLSEESVVGLGEKPDPNEITSRSMPTSLYAQVVPGHRAPLVPEVAGDDSFDFLVRQTLPLQFLAQLLSIVRPEPVGAAVLITERPAGGLHVALIGAVPLTGSSAANRFPVRDPQAWP